MLAIVFTTVFAVFLSLASPAVAVSRGLAWAVDNRFAPTLGNLPLIKWYYHWADPVVDTMPGKVEFVPQMWGTKGGNYGKWEKVKAYMNQHQPQYLLAFNEPDLPGQADMSPGEAVDVYMKEILPWGKRGVKLGSPAIAFKIDWIESFLDQLEKRGGWVDFVACHWYGKHTEFERFQDQILAVRKATGRNIWVTEVGLGADGSYHPTEDQAKDFMIRAFTWMDSQPYIHRAAWFGSFQQDNTPDAFGKPANAFFKEGGSPKLTELAFWYGQAGPSTNHNTPSTKPADKPDDKDDKKDDDDKGTPTKNDAAKPSSSTKSGKKRQCKRTHGPAGKKNATRSLQSRHSRVGALLSKRH